MANIYYGYQQRNHENIKYKKKLSNLKKYVKTLVYENAALCDHVAQIQEDILIIKEERGFLCKRLSEYHKDLLTDITHEPQTNTRKPYKKRSISDANGKTKINKFPKTSKKQNIPNANSSNGPSGSVMSVVTTATHNTSINTFIPITSSATITTSGIHPSSSSIGNIGQDKLIILPTLSASSTSSSSSSSSSVLSADYYRQQQQQQQPTTHTPILPLYINNNLTIYDIGKIVYDRPSYHTENIIYPVGFISTRVYGHIKEPERKCIYTCKIVDDGEYPRFEIIPDSDMEYKIVGPSPDLCHAALIQTINNINTNIRRIDMHPEGDWFFGILHPTVMDIVQNLTDAKKCIYFKSNVLRHSDSGFALDKDNDPSVNYEALQRHISLSVYHTVPEIKEEPPDELLEGFGQFK